MNRTVKYQGAFSRIVGFAGKRFLFSAPPLPHLPLQPFGASTNPVDQTQGGVGAFLFGLYGYVYVLYPARGAPHRAIPFFDDQKIVTQ